MSSVIENLRAAVNFKEGGYIKLGTLKELACTRGVHFDPAQYSTNVRRIFHIACLACYLDRGTDIYAVFTKKHVKDIKARVDNSSTYRNIYFCTLKITRKLEDKIKVLSH